MHLGRAASGGASATKRRVLVYHTFESFFACGVRKSRDRSEKGSWRRMLCGSTLLPPKFSCGRTCVHLRQLLRFAKTTRCGNRGLPRDSRRPLLLTHISVREFRYAHKNNFKGVRTTPSIWVWETQHTRDGSLCPILPFVALQDL